MKFQATYSLFFSKIINIIKVNKIVYYFDDGEGNRSDEIKIESKESNILLEVFSNQSVCIVYTPQNADEVNLDTPFLAIWFETQGFPDWINHDAFPKKIFRKGEDICILLGMQLGKWKINW